jgi:hypothetical protein
VQLKQENSVKENRDYMLSMARYAYPHVFPIHEETGRFRRIWLARVAELLPSEDEITVKGIRLAKPVKDALDDAYGALSTADQLYRSRVDIALVRGDDYRIVIEIICPEPEFRVGDVSAICTWLPIRSVDELWRIEELEGIPRQFWFQLQGDDDWADESDPTSVR